MMPIILMISKRRLIQYSRLWIIGVVIFSSCSEPINPTENRILTEVKVSDDKKLQHSLDDFDLFLAKFNTDCTFQKKHVTFPLPSISNMDWEINDYDTSYISIKEYECIELTSPKSNIMQGLSTLKTIKTNKNLVILTFGIDDTGVHIEYSFQKNENNWQLIKIVDEST